MTAVEQRYHSKNGLPIPIEDINRTKAFIGEAMDILTENKNMSLDSLRIGMLLYLADITFYSHIKNNEMNAGSFEDDYAYLSNMLRLIFNDTYTKLTNSDQSERIN